MSKLDKKLHKLCKKFEVHLVPRDDAIQECIDLLENKRVHFMHHHDFGPASVVQRVITDVRWLKERG